jgi:formylglycine-generating enzyme required for sulfatase activity
MVGWLYDRLEQRLGHGTVFYDRLLQPGQPWPRSLAEKIHQCPVFILMIGAKATSPSDFVAQELDLAATSPDKEIIPVVMDRTTPPDLNKMNLGWIASRQWHPLSTRWFDVDVDRFVYTLERATTREGDIPCVFIPAGEFSMGRSRGDSDAAADESPSHSATILEGYWIGETPVTVNTYEKFARAQSGPIKARYPGFNQNGTDPVVCVSWEEAKRFCKCHFGRLPTEQEWEYAARAGKRCAYGGCRDLDDMAWYGRANDGPREVRQGPANDWGLFDVLGNVWEWCLNCETYDPYAALVPGRQYVARGGSWASPRTRVRVSARQMYKYRDSRHADVGFRFVSHRHPRAPVPEG